MILNCTTVFGWAILISMVACQSAAPTRLPPPAAPLLPKFVVEPDPNATPPAANYMPLRPFPKVQSFSLENGLQIDLIERHSLPVVELELIVDSGLASEGSRAGAAKITPEWLEAGGAGRWNSRQLRESVDALGTSLEISVNRDFSAMVPSCN